MDVKEFIARLEALKRYAPYVDYGCCEMCGTSASMEIESWGGYVSHDDVYSLIKEFKDANK